MQHLAKTPQNVSYLNIAYSSFFFFFLDTSAHFTLKIYSSTFFCKSKHKGKFKVWVLFLKQPARVWPLVLQTRSAQTTTSDAKLQFEGAEKPQHRCYHLRCFLWTQNKPLQKACGDVTWLKQRHHSHESDMILVCVWLCSRHVTPV